MFYNLLQERIFLEKKNSQKLFLRSAYLKNLKYIKKLFFNKKKIIFNKTLFALYFLTQISFPNSF